MRSLTRYDSGCEYLDTSIVGEDWEMGWDMATPRLSARRSRLGSVKCTREGIRDVN